MKWQELEHCGVARGDTQKESEGVRMSDDGLRDVAVFMGCTMVMGLWPEHLAPAGGPRS